MICDCDRVFLYNHNHFLQSRWSLVKWFFEYCLQRFVICFNVYMWHPIDVLVETSATKYYRQHFLFNLSIILLTLFLSALDAYATGWLSCNSTASMPFELASTEILVAFVGSKYFSTGVSLTSIFNFALVAHSSAILHLSPGVFSVSICL